MAVFCQLFIIWRVDKCKEGYNINGGQLLEILVCPCTYVFASVSC